MDLPDQSTRDAGPRSFTADVPDPIWPSIEWPAGPIVRPVGGVPQPKPPKKRGSRWTVALAILGGVLLGTGVTLSVLGIIGVLDRRRRDYSKLAGRGSARPGHAADFGGPGGRNCDPVDRRRGGDRRQQPAQLGFRRGVWR